MTPIILSIAIPICMYLTLGRRGMRDEHKQLMFNSVKCHIPT